MSFLDQEMNLLTTAERIHVYLNVGYWGDIIRLYLTCKMFKREIDDNYIIRLLCHKHNLRQVNHNLSFHIRGMLHYDIERLLISSCINLDTKMTKVCIEVKGCIHIPLLNELIVSVITKLQNMHPIIEILLNSGIVTFNYVSRYSAMAFNYKNDVLGVYFLNKLEKHMFSICSVVEDMCKDDMIVAFRRSEKYWRKIPLFCLNEALKYDSTQIINYLTTGNNKVRTYCSNSNSDKNRRRHLLELKKHGLSYLVEYLELGE